jgi:hypothetical protein
MRSLLLKFDTIAKEQAAADRCSARDRHFHSAAFFPTRFMRLASFSLRFDFEKSAG